MKQTLIICATVLIAAFLLYKASENLKPSEGKVTINEKDTNITVNNWYPKSTAPNITVYNIDSVKQLPVDSLVMLVIRTLNKLKATNTYDSTFYSLTGSDTSVIAHIGLTVSDNEVKQMRLNLQSFNKTIERTRQMKWGVYGGIQARYDRVAKMDYKLSFMLPKMNIGVMKQISGDGFGASVEVRIWKVYGK